MHTWKSIPAQAFLTDSNGSTERPYNVLYNGRFNSYDKRYTII